MNLTSQEQGMFVPSTSNRPSSQSSTWSSRPLSPPPPPPSYWRYQPPAVYPRLDLLSDRKNKDCLFIRDLLYEALMRGDWKFAEIIINKWPGLVRQSITENYETPLHIAASTKRTKQVEEFVANLVELMGVKDLKLKNKNGNTAFCLAVAGESLNIVKIMVKKNKSLLEIPDNHGKMPLSRAALHGNHDIVEYLYKNSQCMSGDYWTPENRGWVLLKCIEADYLDIALKMLMERPKLAKSKGLLDALARKPNAFTDIIPHFIQRIINSVFKAVNLEVATSDARFMLILIWTKIMELPNDKVMHIVRGPFATIVKNGRSIPIMKDGKRMCLNQVLFVAAEMGNTVFIVELIRKYPDLIWKLNDYNQSIFHVAVLHRQKDVYNLLHHFGSTKDLITIVKDDNGNNMLHLVGEIAKNKQLPNISGVALQMQREMSWFKEVEAMIPRSERQRKNKDGLTPHELFTKNHVELVSKSEAWMKETAAHGMVVAALIATVVFGATFTIPGGYDQNTGFPMFLHDRWFMVFVVSDTVSLVFASTSILMFLSILTARYAQEDFFYTLPTKLLIGLITLFLSITSMMIAFSVSFSVLYHKNLTWVRILTSVLSAIPVVFFAKSQYPLLTDVFLSTYGSTFLFKSMKSSLFVADKKKIIHSKNPLLWKVRHPLLEEFGDTYFNV